VQKRCPAKYREYSPPGARKKYQETGGKKYRENVCKKPDKMSTKFTVQMHEKSFEK
jgi:hypothetical protein